MVDLDLLGRMPAALDFGVICQMAWARNLFAPEGKPYPSLESRRRVAMAYVNEFGKGMLATVSRIAVEDVVFDMEVAGTIRGLWLACQGMFPLGTQGPDYQAWGLLYMCKAANDIFESAKRRPMLRQRVLEEGVMGVVLARVAEKGCNLLRMTPEKFEMLWNEFGEAGPKFCGPLLPEDELPNKLQGDDKGAGEGEVETEGKADG